MASWYLLGMRRSSDKVWRTVVDGAWDKMHYGFAGL
jgi:hypothetical protein